MEVGEDDEWSEEEEEVLVFVDLADLNSVDLAKYLTCNRKGDSTTGNNLTSMEEPSLLMQIRGEDTLQSSAPTILPKTINEDEIKIVLKDLDDFSGGKTPSVNIGKMRMQGTYEINLGTLMFFEVNDPLEKNNIYGSSDGPTEDEPTTPSNKLRDIKYIGNAVNRLKCDLVGYDFDEEKMKLLEEEHLNKVRKTVKKAKDASSNKGKSNADEVTDRIVTTAEQPPMETNTSATTTTISAGAI